MAKLSSITNAIEAAQAEHKPQTKPMTIMDIVGEHYWDIRAALSKGISADALAEQFTKEGHECAGRTILNYMREWRRIYEPAPASRSSQKNSRRKRPSSASKTLPNSSASPPQQTAPASAPFVADIDSLPDPFRDKDQTPELTEAVLIQE